MKKLIILLFVTALTGITHGRLYYNAELTSRKKQVEHLVFIKFKTGTTESSIAEFTEEFSRLKILIPAVKSFEVGRNKSPEQLNKGFTHVYKFTFDNETLRDQYLIHKSHKEFSEYATSLGIIDDAMVFDY